MTVLNPWYLQRVGNIGGESLLSAQQLPANLRSILVNASLATESSSQSELAFRQNISVLGEPPSPSTPGTSTSPPTPLLNNISFGAWLDQHGLKFKSDLFSGRNHTSFSSYELKGIYRALTNLTLLGGASLETVNAQLTRECQGFSSRLCSNQSVSIPYSELPTRWKECGVIHVMLLCRNFSSKVTEFLQPSFCPAPSEECFNLTHGSSTLAETYVHSLSEFVQSLLLSFQPVSSEDLLIQTIQSDLALGFSPSSHGSGEEVHGLLTSFWLTDYQLTEPPFWTVFTCLKDREMDNNLKLKGR